MPHALPLPRADLRFGGRTVPVLVRSMCGQDACLALPAPIGDLPGARLVLAWEDGAVTELEVRAGHHDDRDCATHLEVSGVDGAWQPFLAWLGAQAA